MPRSPIVPRQPVYAHLGALVLASALLVAVSACRSGGTMTPRPQPTTTPTPSASPTRTPQPTRTPAPTATTVPTVDPAVPLPVAMTLDEARAEVWSWLDPAHAPRIVSVDYVAGAALATDRFMTRQPLVFDSQPDRDFAELLAGRQLPTTVVRVVAEYAPLDAPLYRQIDDLRGVVVPQSDAPARLLALFDAATGAHLALMSAEKRQVDVLDTTLAAPTVAFTFRATVILPAATADHATWTPMPTAAAMPTPGGPTVEAASVPPAMREVLTAYPLLPGSTWTWESTALNNRVTWTRSMMTETVTGAWQLDDARMVVRTRVERRQVFGQQHVPDKTNEDVDEWRTVTATGAVYPYPVDSPHMHSFMVEPTEREAVRLELPLEALFSPDERFYWFAPEPTTPARIGVTTPAGIFENCGVFEVRGGQTMSSVRAICPGVGYVETDTWAENSNVSWKSVMLLVAYRVVLPR